ncbi:MAG: hypothetical protein LBG95_09545, partial [Treponema sp.]|nr:hypothetical protein [Treponema sp.]
SVGSDASRTAKKDDRYSMAVKVGGTTRTSKGVVTEVSADGTLTLQPDGNGAAFIAVESGGAITSIADAEGGVASITYDDGTKFTPRTFEKIYLRAQRWTNDQDPDDITHGEGWGSGLSVLVKDFPTLVTEFEETVPNEFGENPQRYAVKIQGISDKALPYANVEVQGIRDDDTWEWIGNCVSFEPIPANEPFYRSAYLYIGKSCKFSDYKDFVVQVGNGINFFSEGHPDWNVDHGSIPEDIPDGYIMATISKFGIGLFDTYEVTGNLGFYEFGAMEDGVSPNYKIAQWSLGGEKLELAQTKGNKFVLEITKPTKELQFAWADPVNDTWWNYITVFDGANWNNDDGVTWDESAKKLTIDLDTAIVKGGEADNFYNITTDTMEWPWSLFSLSYETDDRNGILVLGIKSANIVVP